MLIVTLPAAEKTDLVEKMLSHPSVGGARYNTGIRTLYSPDEALARVNEIVKRHEKKLWVDLKGRQLRIAKWADPTYGTIELNREIELDLPAKIFFRGDHCSNIVNVKGRKLVVDPDPPQALGEGQAVNVMAEKWSVVGHYLTEKDEEYINAAVKLKIHDYMLSFMENNLDLAEVQDRDPEAKLILKIENRKGLEYLPHYHPEYGRLLAARDDLMINIGEDKTNMIQALHYIIEKDPEAIVASHLFSSLATGLISMADISDMQLLHTMGYKHFMLGDTISHHRFDDAVKVWGDFWRGNARDLR